ncbi:hypothetical protein NM680_14150 [Paracoccus sp. PS-1]|uniref:hypothetical protein n=1 Tax=unclassified Paracoccus (in: a-proteobacteria) TaxID=2688777 RepID=UPI0004B33F85|nr:MULTISPECIES: hypothetical protein [unclassified Paracoccus (in: a-proteobacteria)]MDQ7262936.1 hypothetical protein [Paracoccus sp. PS1]
MRNLAEALNIARHDSLPIRLLKIGYEGLHKSINLGTRAGESRIEHMAGFFRLARSVEP